MGRGWECPRVCPDDFRERNVSFVPQESSLDFSVFQSVVNSLYWSVPSSVFNQYDFWFWRIIAPVTTSFPPDVAGLCCIITQCPTPRITNSRTYNPIPLTSIGLTLRIFGLRSRNSNFGSRKTPPESPKIQWPLLRNSQTEYLPRSPISSAVLSHFEGEMLRCRIMLKCYFNCYGI
jgi:hypothetical protein